MIKNVEVRAEGMPIEKMLKRFEKLSERTGLSRDIKRSVRTYVPPGQRRRLKSRAARKRLRRAQAAADLL